MTKSFFMGITLLIASKSQAAISKKPQFETQKNKITVAIIDTGADINHKELESAIWTNAGETGLDQFGHDKASNNIDDDGNGFADDIHGWNFVDNNNDLLDTVGHGTHVSGIIKNESSKSPTLKNCKDCIRLMILKYYNPEATDSENIKNTVKAINYAVQMQAQIINYSGGGSLPNIKEKEAIEKALTKNILFVAAAGNNKSNTDIVNYYPANYGLANIISVAATDNDGDLVSFSNYGQKTVDIAAPGKHIFSTLPDNKYGFLSGTSQATAFVTGLAALKLYENTAHIGTQKVLDIILSSGRYKKSLVGKTKFNLALLNSQIK